MELFKILVLFFISNIVQIKTQMPEKSNIFVMQIKGDKEDARRLCQKYGYTLLYEIIPGYFATQIVSAVRRGSLRTDRRFTSFIKRESRVLKLEQQTYNKRTLRYFNDRYWNKMWYYNEAESIPSMGVMRAWENGYTGKGVTIGIVDDGIEHRHTDLRLQMDSGIGYDFVAVDQDPSPDVGNSHGTKCAGIAGAEPNNTRCIMGASYDAKLLGLKIFDYGGFSIYAWEAAALAYRPNIIDIYVNSWGPRDHVGVNGPPEIVQLALESGIRRGRNGKGSIYVWAAGNGGTDDNCNCDGYVNSIYTIGISGAAHFLYPAYYDEQCSAIFATTYSSDTLTHNVITTDLNDRCGNFSGSSANAPMAAGIIALALEANKNLTWRDVQHLIVKTSKKHNLIDTDGWLINGAGFDASHFYGFGLMDALALTEAASNWTLVPRQKTCMLPPRKINSAVNFPIRSTLDVLETNGCNNTENEIKFLEHVQCEISIEGIFKHVQLTLKSPSGTESKLLSRRRSDTTSGRRDWTYTSLFYWGEDPTGEWSLTFDIANGGGNGTLVSWRLLLYGTTTDPALGGQEEITNLPETRAKDKENTIELLKIILGILGSVGGWVLLQLVIILCLRFCCVKKGESERNSRVNNLEENKTQEDKKEPHDT